MNTNKPSGLLIGLFVVIVAIMAVPQTAFSQKETLGIVHYESPKGWKRTPSANIVTFSETIEATGRFCTITLYGATPGTGSAKSDFTREWNNLVVTPFKGEADPKTETDSADGWTITAGGSAVEVGGGKALAFLTVFSRGETTVSVLGIFNEESYLSKLVAFGSSLEINTPAVAAITQPAAETPSQPIAPAAATMNAAGLVREFENNEIRANQQYIGRRVRITGTVNVIEINKSGQIVLTFKSSITTSRNARCYFARSQSARVGALNAHELATVEGTVKGLGDGFDNSKAYLVLEDCIVP